MVSPATQSTPPLPAARRKATVHGWLWLLLVMALAAWPLRGLFQQRLLEQTALTDLAPSSEVVSQTIQSAADPVKAILTAWASGHIVPRTVALQELNSLLPKLHPVPESLQTLLSNSALDPDNGIREITLGLMQQMAHPQYPAAVIAQLKNVDPEIRLMALRRVRDLPLELGMPLATQHLNDDDPRIIGTALNLLGRWAHQDFGVRLADTVSVGEDARGIPEFRPATREIAAAGATRARQWLAVHSNEFQFQTKGPLSIEGPNLQMHRVEDFKLQSVDGKSVRLSDFQGKRVLINFWTTWCSACVGEIPTLVELQRRHPDDLVVLGISLDGVPDEHGHIGGHEAHSDGEDHDHEHSPSLKELRQQVAKFVERRGMKYQVLLDPENSVGGRFNGGELPTTILIDKSGILRRGFVGGRNLDVFEAMIGELVPLSNLSAAVVP